MKLLLSHIFIVGRRFSVHPQKRSTGVNLRHRPLVLHDLHCTVQRAFVLVSFETLSERTHTGHKPCQQLGPGRPGDSTHLHSGLDDVQGSVSEHAGSASDGSEHTGYHGVNGFVGVIPLVIHKWSHSGAPAGSRVCYYRFIHTFVPVPQHGHDVKADGLVGALFQHCGRQTLISPLQSWGYINNISHICQMFNLHS